MAEHEPSIGATPEWFTSPEYFEGPEPPSHGENRGSSPLGSANDFSSLAPKRVDPASPTFLQWTVL